VKGDYRRAMLEYKIASQNTPRDPEPIYRLGLAALEAKDGKAAVGAFEKVLKLNENHEGGKAVFERHHQREVHGFAERQQL